MQATSPLSLYQQMLAQGEYQADDIQAAAIARLDRIHQQLGASRNTAANAPSGLLRLLGKKWLGKGERVTDEPVQGLYMMWGRVGRGKTWLMDLFYRSLPGKRKLRLHFHRFMLRVYEEMTRLQGHQDPLEIIADGFKAETDVLCFNEFFVIDHYRRNAAGYPDAGAVCPRHYACGHLQYSAGRSLPQWVAARTFPAGH